MWPEAYLKYEAARKRGWTAFKLPCYKFQQEERTAKIYVNGYKLFAMKNMEWHKSGCPKKYVDRVNITEVWQRGSFAYKNEPTCLHGMGN